MPDGQGPHPVVVAIHGGWWRVQHGIETQAHMCAALASFGIATWNIEFRRIGEDGGGWPGTFQDVSQATDQLVDLARTRPLDLRHVVALGFSAGGHLALWLAARPRLLPGTPIHAPPAVAIRGALSLAGAVDLHRCSELALSNGVVDTFMGGSPRDVPDRFAAGSPAELVPLGVRQILLHGTSDHSVPWQVSQSYYQKAVGSGDRVELMLLQEVGHFELLDPMSPVWPIVLQSVRALIRPSDLDAA